MVADAFSNTIRAVAEALDEAGGELCRRIDSLEDFDETLNFRVIKANNPAPGPQLSMAEHANFLDAMWSSLTHEQIREQQRMRKPVNARFRL
ncbi:MAG: hypothetical protein ACOCWJ_04100 [Verrucomicrobiota bacterium]